VFRQTYVCYTCMETRRSYPDCYCPKCGKIMRSISWKLSIPKKDRKLWEEAFLEWGKMNPYYLDIMTGDKE